MAVVRRNASNICKENYRRIYEQVYEHDVGWGLYIVKSSRNSYTDLTITEKRIKFKRLPKAGRAVRVDMLIVQRMTGLLLNCGTVEENSR